MVAASENDDEANAPRAGAPEGAPFEIGRVLGQGGSGTVYAVERDGREFAFKVLRADLALSEREHRKFLQEAERMRRLAHPAIVPLVDAGTLADGRPYLAMPLLSGETLASRVARGPLDVPTALRYFAEIAAAVAVLHDVGLIHRDVKPENVFVCRDEGTGEERPILLDLGIARDIEDAPSTTTERGSVRGTRAYMAPERFFGTPASTATDVYELGVLLYVMLVGETPWVSGDGATGRLHPRDPSELGIALPEKLATTLLRALSTRPEVRPSSVAAFADQVRDAMRGNDAVGVDAVRDDAARDDAVNAEAVSTEMASLGAAHGKTDRTTASFDVVTQRFGTDVPGAPDASMAATNGRAEPREGARSRRVVWLAAGGLAVTLAAVGIVRWSGTHDGATTSSEARLPVAPVASLLETSPRAPASSAMTAPPSMAASMPRADSERLADSAPSIEPSASTSRTRVEPSGSVSTKRADARAGASASPQDVVGATAAPAPSERLYRDRK